MQPYRIQVTGNRRTHSLEITVASDFAAVRRAEHIARPGDKLAVWRGDKCIFERDEAAQRFG